MRTSARLLLSTLCILVAMPVASAQKETGKITLMPHWRKGEKRQYAMVKARRKVQGPAALSGKGTTPVLIEVLDANDAGHLLSWTMGETQVEDPALAADPIAKAVVELTKNTTVVFQLDGDTRLTAVRNWQQLRAVGNKIAEACLQEMKRRGMDDTTVGKARQQFESLLGTRQQIEILFTRSSQIFFAPLGVEYSLGRPFEYEDKLANPFGGEPFPTRASFTLEKMDAASDIAIITWRQEIDPVAGARILEKIVRDLAARLGKPVPSGRLLDFINVKDVATFTVHLSSGWPQRVSYTRTMTTAGVSQEDSLTFEEVKQ